MHSVPVPINVRCYSNSDIIVRRSEMTLRAISDRLHCGKTASLFAITNSGYPLCGWQAIAKSRQLLEQRHR
jgi:hypothetical protein